MGYGQGVLQGGLFWPNLPCAV